MLNIDNSEKVILITLIFDLFLLNILFKENECNAMGTKLIQIHIKFFYVNELVSIFNIFYR